MKKLLSITVALILALSIFAGCGSKTDNQANSSQKSSDQTQTQQSASSASWTVAIEGVDGKTSFTSDDFSKLNVSDIQATKKKKDGTEVKNTWTGVSLSDVLKALGVESYTKVVVSAKDNYSKEYTPDIVNSKDTIVAIKCDGKDIGNDEGPTEIVAASQAGNMWIKNLAKIQVVK